MEGSCVMRQAILRAKCDTGVHQRSLKADSLFGAKEQRKLYGSIFCHKCSIL